MESEKIGNVMNYSSKYGSVRNNLSNPLSYKTHLVLDTDTLISVAIQYDVSVDEIKKVNGLWSGSFIGRKEIKIPINTNTGIDYENLEEFLTDSQEFQSFGHDETLPQTDRKQLYKSHEISLEDYLANIDKNIQKVKTNLNFNDRL